MATYNVSIPADFGAGGTGLVPSGGSAPSLRDHLLGVQTAINATDASANALAAKVTAVSGVKFVKEQPCAAPENVLAEFVFHQVKTAATVSVVEYIPSAALTANNTNYATFTLVRRRAGVAATIATLVTNIAGTGDWVAFTSEVAASLANTNLLAGDLLTLAITKAGAGATVPAGVFVVTLS